MKEKDRQLKELIGVSKEHLQVSKGIKKVSEKTYRSTEKSYNIQTISAIIIGITLIFTILIWKGVLSINIGSHVSTFPDYDVNVTYQTDPPHIFQNNKNSIDLIMTFENVGSQNITDFGVWGVNLYRPIDKLESFLYQYGSIYSTYRNGKTYYTLDCGIWSWDRIFVPHQKCTFRIPLSDGFSITNSQFWDDKFKTVQVLIYFNSKPPIQNKAINLTIE